MVIAAFERWAGDRDKASILQEALSAHVIADGNAKAARRGFDGHIAAAKGKVSCRFGEINFRHFVKLAPPGVIALMKQAVHARLLKRCYAQFRRGHRKERRPKECSPPVAIEVDRAPGNCNIGSSRQPARRFTMRAEVQVNPEVIEDWSCQTRNKPLTAKFAIKLDGDARLG